MSLLLDGFFSLAFQIHSNFIHQTCRHLLAFFWFHFTSTLLLEMLLLVNLYKTNFQLNLSKFMSRLIDTIEENVLIKKNSIFTSFYKKEITFQQLYWLYN